MNLVDFGFLSDGLIDKVIFIKEGVVPPSTFSLNVSTDTTEIFFPHVSVSLDGLKWYTDESPRYSDASTFPDISVSATCYSGLVRMFPTLGAPGGFYRIIGVKNDIQ